MRMKLKEQEYYNNESGKSPQAEYDDPVNPPKLLPLFSHKRNGSYNPRISIEESDVATNVAIHLDNTVESTLQ